MNKRQAKKLELKNEIKDIQKDYKLQDKKLDELNDNFLNEINNMMKQFERQEKLLKANKESLANIIQTQSYLEKENNEKMIEMNEVIKKYNDRICILEYSVFGMIILMIIIFVLEVIKWFM